MLEIETLIQAESRYSKLAWLKKAHVIAINSFLVNLVTTLRIAPAGMRDVHDMLVNVANSLIAGGETGETQACRRRNPCACCHGKS